MDKYITANAVFSRFSRDYMGLKKGWPIRPSEMGVLNSLASTPGPHTSVMLAELLGVSKPMITAYLTALSKRGYIVKEQSPSDRRAYYVRLTPKALELVETTRAETHVQLDNLASAMGQEDFDQLVALLQKANQILKVKEDENK